MKKRRKFAYLLVYYLVFIMGFSIIKHFAGWNAQTFADLGGTESNFIGSTLAFLSEIILSLAIGLSLFLITPIRPMGKFIMWATATVIPATFIFLIMAHFTIHYVNGRWMEEADKHLHTEIINRLPHNLFKKKSGSHEDFSGYVTADNDSLGWIVADSNKMARVYIYIDSVKLGSFNFDTCTVCNGKLQQVLTEIVLPLQTLSAEEAQHNINMVKSGQCYVRDRNIYIGNCHNAGKRFIIINNVYDRVRDLHCYEIGFQADVKTPAANQLGLF